MPDYQEILLTTFEDFLVRDDASEKTRKNYKSDLRHFLTWLQNSSEAASRESIASEKELLSLVSAERLENYKQTQLLSQVPAATINRRLSALRIFFRFANLQGWVMEDPTRRILNIPKAKPPSEHQSLDQLIVSFEENMRKNNQPWSESGHHDLLEFFDWLKMNQPSHV